LGCQQTRWDAEEAAGCESPEGLWLEGTHLDARRPELHSGSVPPAAGQEAVAALTAALRNACLLQSLPKSLS
jgi:hypothetical protein